MSASNLEQAKRIISERVELFQRNLDQYRRAEYKEAQLRVEFLDPFFEALGWDVANRQGWAEQYKEVVNEDALKMSGATKAPDYSFRIGGVRKFFVEAKKPALSIKTDASAAYQLRRYAWSAKLPVSILSDFEEFAIYDCRQRPSDKDGANVGRINFFSYEQYLERLPEIYDVFSKEAVLRGSFDRFMQETRGKRGTTQVDAEFLKEIEGWRELLAKNIALSNPRLTLDELNDAVQRTIDRVIFLRMAEDRGTEEYGQLQRLIKTPTSPPSQGGDKRGGVYPRLIELCRQADAKYNSGLFDFANDALTPRLKVDDDKLSAILADLYYPQSPYEFSVLGADTLGNVYEQFLGKVIRLTPSHQAKVEEKPEVKKAGGVYYTPTYIVDYIVKQTVGKLIAGKSPKEIEKVHVLDPACGSGSFLLGAYQLLLDHHLAWYVQGDGGQGTGDGKRAQPIYQSATGWRLTTAEKKRILLNNIFGVDIDRQAVEVTKLSLLLKVLEGENQETLGKQLKLFRERALPNLDQNIKCGNSLIGWDYFAGKMFADAEEVKRVNPFDWEREFPQVFNPLSLPLAKGEQVGVGGFDCVIGNPPYVLLQILNEPEIFKYLSNTYKAARYKIDTYQLFMEKGIGLSTLGGYLGYITPNSFLTNKHARELRQLILHNSNVELLRVFSYQVFRGASVDTSIIILNRTDRPNRAQTVEVVRSKASSDFEVDHQAQQTWLEHPDNFFTLPSTAGTEELKLKMQQGSHRLGEFATAYFGIQTYDRTQYVKVSSKARHFKPVIDGANIYRYALSSSREFVDFRPEAIKSGGKSEVYEQERIGVRQIGQVPVATIVPAGIYSLNTVYNIFFTTKTEYELPFILGVFCSQAIRWYWRQSFFDQKQTFPKIKKDALLSVPIPQINFDDPLDKSRHDQMVALVDQMLELNKRLRAANTQADHELIQRQIDATDKQIDALVYELYELTDEEIAIVEASAA